jgi:hypothetical protein
VSHYGSVKHDRWTGRRALAPYRAFSPGFLVLEWAMVTFAACAILTGGVFAGLYRARPDFDRQAQAFADDAAEAMAASPTPSELFARAAPDLVDMPSPAAQAGLDRLAALGPGAASQGCRGQSRIEPLGVYSVLTARYRCTVRSGLGEADLVLDLGRDLHAWRITGFHLDAPLTG